MALSPAVLLRAVLLWAVLLWAVLLWAVLLCAAPAGLRAAEPDEALSGGGATTMRTPDRNAFSRVAPNLSVERRLDFKVGAALFGKLWVSAPSSTTASDGLGPLYNARACSRCHIRNGRGRPPEGPDDNSVSMPVRLSVPPRSDAELAAIAGGRLAAIPETTYGAQLQSLAIQGHAAEGRVAVDYEETEVTLADGTAVALRQPRLRVERLGFGPLDPETMLSARVAPPVIGLGLLEAVPEAEILAAADPDDADGDGVSGRPNRVWSLEAGRVMLGRFGWKAGEPGLRQQIAAALSTDIGIDSSLFPAGHGDCTAAQADCRAAPNGDTPRHGDLEASDTVLDLLLHHARHVAVPARRDLADPAVREGQRLFHASGCAACHRPVLITGAGAGLPALSGQTIRPYSDLLLHDMGEGLADHRPEAAADGREWRTPPLWGLGLTDTVGGHTLLLHDGRARSLLEAVLWHGGEAAAARARVVAMSRAEREALLRFLRSL